MRDPTPAPRPDDAASNSGNGAHLELEMARDLVLRQATAGRRSTAEMLRELRRAFPHSPLAVRVRALEALRRR